MFERDHALQHARIDELIRWLLPLMAVFIALYAGIAVRFGSWSFAAASGEVAAFTGVVLVSRRQLRRGRLPQATELLALGLLLLSIGLIHEVPWLLPALAFVPLGACVLCVPHLDGPRLARTLVLSFLGELLLLTLGFQTVDRDTFPPVGMQHVIVMLSVASAVTLTFVLLWFDASRLRLSERRAAASARESRELEERLQAIVASAPLVLFAVDKAGRFTLSEGRSLEQVGLRRGEVIGRSVFEMYADRPWILDAIGRALRGERQVAEGLADGRYFQTCVMPARDEAGRVVGAMGVALDVTERRRAHALLQLLVEGSRILAEESHAADHGLRRLAERIVAAMGPCFAVFVADPAGTFRRVAHAHGSGGAAACPLPRLEAPEALAGRLQPGRHSLLLDPWGGRVLCAPLRTGERLSGLMVFTGAVPHSGDDIALAQELAQRTAMALDNARLYQEAQDAVRIREKFLAIASHELKTPLTPLQLQVKSILRGATRGQFSMERVLKKTEIIDVQVTRLIALVDDLLDISRIAAGRMNLTLARVDLAHVATDVATRFQAAALRAAAPIEVDAPKSVWGLWDALRVEQVMTNLLSNATKYGAGHPIEVRVRQEGAVAWLTVRDHGIGIAPEHQARIFDRFERAVSERHYGGLGLGLWIVRQIVDSLGGQI
ncbi:MAG TPA: ATP-binding protein, partial [Myxococcota bacterium]|nr:ATP-binding protein [Myxococcota bacterium]